MFYEHQYFVLDTTKKKVFDENGKELRLTANSYRVLSFLCEKESANITEIGEHLDFAKSYDENHIRQYRYKIKLLIGHDVIEYKNGVYSLVGECKKVDKLEKKERITDLLQKDTLKLEKNSEQTEMTKKKSKIEFTKVPAIIASIMLLLTFFDWPYGYYSFLRLVVTGVAGYYAYYLYETSKKLGFQFWSLIVIGVLFNPIAPIYLYDKSLWGIIDIVVAVFFVSFIIKKKI